MSDIVSRSISIFSCFAVRNVSLCVTDCNFLTEMRQKGGLDDLYKELDFKLAVLTKQYNVSHVMSSHLRSVVECDGGEET